MSWFLFLLPWSSSWASTRFSQLLRVCVLQTARSSRSSPTPTPTWTTAALALGVAATTLRGQQPWQTCPAATWGSSHTPGSTFSSTTLLRDHAHYVGWAASAARLSMAVWSAAGAGLKAGPSTCGCTLCHVSTCGTKPWGEAGGEGCKQVHPGLCSPCCPLVANTGSRCLKD